MRGRSEERDTVRRNDWDRAKGDYANGGPVDRLTFAAGRFVATSPVGREAAAVGYTSAEVAALVAERTVREAVKEALRPPTIHVGREALASTSKLATGGVVKGSGPMPFLGDGTHYVRTLTPALDAELERLIRDNPPTPERDCE